ncbi:glycosyltransferase family 39 protein [Aurantiacibacter sp. MUD11]|uniref:ArnT family glycosyltransferase n=1 Tax=Aurantiacibacter sp. MUD11 TaxID=3003265 RepID=UPI0022A9F83B|nr:glycosyltransferase family 39 protein [Aurantiacibacter sp. MUD11]WAT18756.1 glycosyltransferase family 39 protein [Aurantiacibacter sp. MUD11]
MTSVAASPESGTTAQAQSWLRGDAPWLVPLALLVLAVRGIWFGDPVADFDEQLYSFIGWRMQYGELPFVDWWDRKPFGLFAVFGVAHALFGPSALAYQLVAAGFAFLTALLTFRLARRLVDRAAATAAAAIAVLLLSAYASYSGQSEVFFVPMMLVMATLLVDPDHPHFTRRAAVAMLLGGLALQVKYTVVPQCAFFGLYALWVEYRRGRSVPALAAIAALFAAMGLLPTILVGAFYAAIGDFDAFWFANFASFFERAAAPQGRWIPSHLIGVAPVAILAAGGTYAALRMNRPEPFATWLFFAGWALATLATVLLPGTVYLYYYAAMSAPAALVALPLLDRRGPMKLGPALVLPIALLALLSLPDRRVQSLEERAAAAELARAISPHVGREENCLWIWDGPTALYRLADSCVPTRFVYPDHLNNALETGALGVDQVEEISRILASQPGAIVTADTGMTIRNPDAAALVDQALASDFEEKVTVQMHGRNITAWVRRSPSSVPATATTGTAPQQ